MPKKTIRQESSKLSHVGDLIYAGKLHEAWKYAMSNPIYHTGSNKPMIGIRNLSGQWVVIFPVVETQNPTLDDKLDFLKKYVPEENRSPQIPGTRYLVLT